MIHFIATDQLEALWIVFYTVCDWNLENHLYGCAFVINNQKARALLCESTW